MWPPLHHVKEVLDDIGEAQIAWAIWKGVRAYWASARDVVLCVAWLLAFGRKPVNGLENGLFTDPSRKALTWGTLMVLIILTGAVLSYQRQQKAVSA